MSKTKSTKHGGKTKGVEKEEVLVPLSQIVIDPVRNPTHPQVAESAHVFAEMEPEDIEPVELMQVAWDQFYPSDGRIRLMGIEERVRTLGLDRNNVKVRAYISKGKQQDALAGFFKQNAHAGIRPCPVTTEEKKRAILLMKKLGESDNWIYQQTHVAKKTFHKWFAECEDFDLTDATLVLGKDGRWIDKSNIGKHKKVNVTEPAAMDDNESEENETGEEEIDDGDKILAETTLKDPGGKKVPKKKQPKPMPGAKRNTEKVKYRYGDKTRTVEAILLPVVEPSGAMAIHFECRTLPRMKKMQFVLEDGSVWTPATGQFALSENGVKFNGTIEQAAKDKDDQPEKVAA